MSESHRCPGALRRSHAVLNPEGPCSLQCATGKFPLSSILRRAYRRDLATSRLPHRRGPYSVLAQITPSTGGLPHVHLRKPILRLVANQI